MRIRTTLLLAIAAILAVTCLLFSGVLYLKQKQTLLEGIDEKLFAAGESIPAIIGENYHDRITDEASIAPDEYLSIVDRFNVFCRRAGLQYLWSVMVIDGKVRFTSATSPGKDSAQGDQAAFFEEHSNPEAFNEAFSTMQVGHSSFYNKWGSGRMVLIPQYDAKGRKYCLGASMSTGEVDSRVAATARQAAVISLLVLSVGLCLSMAFARSLSSPISQITQFAERAAGGDLCAAAPEAGSAEVRSLSRSINSMVASIRRRLAEVQEGRENLRITLQSIGDGVIAADLNGCVTEMNSAAEQLTGWKAEEAIGKPIAAVFPIVHEYTGVPMENPALQAVRQGRPAHLSNHTILAAKDGVRRAVADSASPIRSAAGAIVGSVLVFRDVTEAQRAQAERLRLIAILESTTDLVGTAGTGGEVDYLNKAGRQMLGWNDIEGKRLFDAHTPAGAARLHREIIPAVRRKGVWTGEHAFCGSDGAEIPVSQVIMAHRGPEGRIEYFSTIARDLRPQKQAEQEQQRLEHQLQHAQKLEVLGTLTGGIAHDFNNLLMPIFGYLDLMLVDAPEGSLMQRRLGRVRAAAGRAADLVQQILCFSGRAEHKRVFVDMKEAVAAALGLLRPGIPSSIDIRAEISGSCPPVMGDPTQIHQVIMNLVANAAQASASRPGKIELELKQVDVDDQTVRRHIGLREGPYVCLVVRDDGCGMDENTKRRIFEPFFTTKGSKGSGLGLSVVHGIVTRHNGAISVESTPGSGSSFCIYLPAVQRELTLPPDPAPPLQPGSGKILLVDDEAEIREAYRELLERLGYSVTACSAGDEALEQLLGNSGGFDLLITDQTMPATSGIELVARIRREGLELPVILMSGYSEQVTAGELVRTRITRFIKKPVGLYDLAAAVQDILSANGQRTSTNPAC